MKKIKDLLFIVTFILVLVVGFSVGAIRAYTPDKSKYAYSISLIEYNYVSKDEKQIGQPIMIYSPDFFNDRGTINNGASYPKNWSQLLTEKYLVPFVEAETPDKKVLINDDYIDSYAPNFFPEVNNIIRPAEKIDFISLGFDTDWNIDKIKFNEDHRKLSPSISYTVLYNSAKELVHCYRSDVVKDLGYSTFSVSYLSGNIDLNYKGDIKYFRYNGKELGDTFRRIIKLNIPGNINESFDFLNSYIIDNFSLYENSPSILYYFGENISNSNLKKYYFKIESLELVDGSDTGQLISLEKFNPDLIKPTSLCTKSGVYKPPCTKVDLVLETNPCYEKETHDCYNASKTQTFKDEDACTSSCTSETIGGFEHDCKGGSTCNYKVRVCPSPTYKVAEEGGLKFYEKKDGTGYEGVRNVAKIYKQIRVAYTNVVKSRDRGEDSYHADRAHNLKTEEKNTFCRKNGVFVNGVEQCATPLVYEKYIGPSLSESLVSEHPNSKYVFDDTVGNDNKKPNGIRYIYYFDEARKDDCSNICSTNPSLKCAEDYCDNISNVTYVLGGNSRERKKNCIVNTCNYVPKRDVLAEPRNNPVTYNTSCGVLNDNKIFNGAFSWITQESINESDTDDSNDLRFDARKYIKAECKEDSNVSLKMSPLTNEPGKTINHDSTVNVSTTCKYTFDAQQWTFDFATVHSQDKKNRTKLLYIYNTFNNMQNHSSNNPSKYVNYANNPTANIYRGNSSSMGPYYDSEMASIFGRTEYEQLGKVDFSRYFYRAYTSANHTHNEVVNQEYKVSISDKIAKEEIVSDTLLTISRGDVGKSILIVAHNSVYSMPQYSFTVKNSTKRNYLPFTKCVSVDKNTTPTYSINNENCTKSQIATNNFYVNNNATPNNKFPASLKNSGITHNVETGLTVTHDHTPVINLNDRCNYYIPTPPVPFCKCAIDIDKESDDAEYDGNVLKSGLFKYTIKPTERLAGQEIKSFSFSFKKKNYSEQNGKENIYILNPNYTSFDEDNMIYGEIEMTNGDTCSCEKPFSVQAPDQCVIKKTEVNGVKYIYNVESLIPGEKYIEINDDGERREVPSDGLFIPEPDCTEPNSPSCNRKITGYVVNNDQTLACDLEDRDLKKIPTCKDIVKENERADQKKVRETCEVGHPGYESYNDCINNCGICIDTFYGPGELNIVKGICDEWSTYGFGSEKLCYSRCYRTSPDPNYNGPLFRQVSNYDPFPYSLVSPRMHNELIRQVGENWYALDEYITNDDDDMTSVTGQHASKNIPEYEITLSPSDIRSIRKNNNEKGNIYADYDPRTTEVKSPGFKSKFIHEDAEFSGLFTYIAGEKVK